MDAERFEVSVDVDTTELGHFMTLIRGNKRSGTRVEQAVLLYTVFLYWCKELIYKISDLPIQP